MNDIATKIRFKARLLQPAKAAKGISSTFLVLPMKAIVGTWLLVSIVDVLEDGSISHWMGEHPTGAIIFPPRVT